jgi:hypothetical protein
MILRARLGFSAMISIICSLLSKNASAFLTFAKQNITSANLTYHVAKSNISLQQSRNITLLKALQIILPHFKGNFHRFLAIFENSLFAQRAISE